MKPASLFQEHMILQRGKIVPVWGEARPGERIEVSVQGKQSEAKADAEGRWTVRIGPLEAQESGTLEIRGEDEHITLQDVAVGDIFLAGGQSNMEFLMRYEKHFSAERAECENPAIRFFDVPEIAYDGQERDFDYGQVGIWRKADRENLDYFSAPAYYFAKALWRELGIPVGIVGLNWGGTRTSAWMREDHARAICPEQVADFEAKLKGKSFEELAAEAGKSLLNDRGYSTWDPFSEFIMAGTPGPEEIGAFFAKMGAMIDLSNIAEFADPKMAPGILYEQMVKKTAPFGVKGVLWYQGESDDEVEGSAAHYAQSLQTLIADWRALWGEALPFFVVQLPGFRSWLAVVGRDYPLIRQAQQETADADENAFLCSISDLGQELDIHPKNKKDVGERLALLALRHLYGRDILADPPRPVSCERTGNHVLLRFANAGDVLSVRGETVNALELRAGKEKLPYRFAVSGDCLELCAENAGERPITVSFAGGDWYRVNLYNSAGLPAIPFEIHC